jgi:hypothetical protein
MVQGLDASYDGAIFMGYHAWREPRAACLATVGANLAHGIGHGPIGSLVSAWPALALVGAFELLMMLIRAVRQDQPGRKVKRILDQAA